MIHTEQERIDRRAFLRTTGLGIGALAVAGALDLMSARDASAGAGP